MYADLNPGPVTPEWYADLRQVATADDRQWVALGLSLQPGQGDIPTVTAGTEPEGWGAVDGQISDGLAETTGTIDFTDPDVEEEEMSEVSSITMATVEDWQDHEEWTPVPCLGRFSHLAHSGRKQ